MPSQLPNNQQQNPRKSDFPRHRVVEVMTAAQEDAMAQLRREGVPEAYALAVIERISAFCLRTLRELDRVFREFEELLANDPERTQAHQAWLDTKAGGLLLMLESTIASLIAEAIEKAKADYRTHVSPPKEAVTMPAQPPQAAREEYPVWMLLVWMSGIAASTLLSWQSSASIIWAGIGWLIPLLLWCKVGKSGWGLVFPLIGIGMEAYAVLWHLIVEGGF
jgi:hypothetical protein